MQVNNSCSSAVLKRRVHFSAMSQSMSGCTFLTPPLLSPESGKTQRLNSIPSHSPVKDALSFNFSTDCPCFSFLVPLCVGEKRLLQTCTPQVTRPFPHRGTKHQLPSRAPAAFVLLNRTGKTNPLVLQDSHGLRASAC